MFDLGFVWRKVRDLNPRRLSPQRFSRPPQSAALPTFLKKFAGFIVAERLFFVNRPRFTLRNIRKKYDGAVFCRLAVALRRFAEEAGYEANRFAGRSGKKTAEGRGKRVGRKTAEGRGKRVGQKTAEGRGKRVGQKTAEGRGKQIRQKDRRRQGQTNRAKRPPKTDGKRAAAGQAVLRSCCADRTTLTKK